MPTLPLEISCHELQQQLNSATPPLLIDCREPEEYAIVKLSGAKLVPLQTVPEALQEIQEALQGESAPDRVVVYCHHGMRSAQAAAWLREHDLPTAQSLAGGIDAWSQQIDAELPRY